MQNLTKNRFNQVTYLWVIVGFITVTSCNKELTARSVEKNIEQARKATDKAKQKSHDAIASRRELFMKTRQSKINEMQSRVDQIDGRLSSLNNISQDSPNKKAVTDVNSAMANFQHEKDSVTQKIEQFKSIQVPDWDASVSSINQAVERIENELKTIEKTLDNK